MEKGGTRVLIADDRFHVRSALRLLLRERLGVTVVDEAVTLEQALELASMEEPDLVLLDWELSAQGGATALVGLRTARPGLAIIALSSNPESRRAALEAGADEFISKGDPPEQLVDSMESHCCK
jgi:DNA-binding NarL/FixJ family response regulator